MVFVRIGIFAILLISSQLVIAEQKQYIIGVDTNDEYPLYRIDNNPEGFYIDIMEKFAQSTNIKFIYKKLPKDNLYSSFYNQEIDLRLVDNPNWHATTKREHNVIYSTAIHFYINGMFIMNDRNLDIHQIKNLGVVTDSLIWSMQHYLHNNKIDIKKAKNCNDLIEPLMNGEIDIIYCNYQVMQYHLKGNKQIVFASHLPYID